MVPEWLVASAKGVHILNLSTGATQLLLASELGNLMEHVAWWKGGKLLFVTERGPKSTLISLDVAGRSHVLKQSDGFLGVPVPSPDGRHLAFNKEDDESNVWLIENF